MEENLPFSYRTARRYQFLYQHRRQIGIRKPKTLAEAEKAMEKAARASVMDAVSADYARIDRDLIAPIRLVRRRIIKVTYIGDDPQTMKMIWEDLKGEVQDLLGDLKLLEPMMEHFQRTKTFNRNVAAALPHSGALCYGGRLCRPSRAEDSLLPASCDQCS